MWTLYFATVVSIFFFLFSSPILSGWIGCLPYFHTWCGLSANLECMSEMCCTQLAENKCKNYAKNHHLRTIAQLCRAISSQLRHVSTIGKKVLNSNISFTCPHNMVNVGALTAEIGWRVFDTPENFTIFASWLCYCTNVAQWRSTKLCTMFGCLLGWYIIQRVHEKTASLSITV